MRYARAEASVSHAAIMGVNLALIGTGVCLHPGEARADAAVARAHFDKGRSYFEVDQAGRRRQRRREPPAMSCARPGSPRASSRVGWGYAALRSTRRRLVYAQLARRRAA